MAPTVRMCLHCFEPEHEHIGGRCLFESTPFAPHRLQGDSVQSGLWSQVIVDVHMPVVPLDPLDAAVNLVMGSAAESTGIPLKYLGFDLP